MKDNNYFPIELELLRIDTILGVDLFLKGDRDYILYRSRTVPFNDRVRRNLIGHGVKQLYVPSADADKFNRYIENNLPSILADPLVKPEQKRQLVYESSIAVARELLHDPSSPETLKRSTRIVTGMVDLHLKDEGGFKKIIELMPSDYNLIHHSANVATYSIALGKALGISKNDLYELGLGALLHDIGKSKIPQEILYKPGKLTFDEFAIVKNHVLHGIDIAAKNPVVPKQALLPILWHHERLSGDGYPYGKSDIEIPLFGLITAVSDSFDAMTTKRVYQNAHSTFHALETLLAENDKYDPRVVLELVKLMGPDKTIKDIKSKISMSVV
jgi:putative nucleotidyltransferase with HDIG domain